MKKLYSKLSESSAVSFTNVLKENLAGCDSILEVGCGANSPLGNLKLDCNKVGIDLFEPSIEKSKALKIHNEYHKLDVMEIVNFFGENSFDAVIALDLIEHLTKEDGLKLMQLMEKVAKKKIIIYTPNGFLPQGEYDNNPWQVHHSGWEVEEMQNYGYKVFGINGLKFIRGEYANIIKKPRFIWRMISDISRYFTINNPKKAFQILCVKEK